MPRRWVLALLLAVSSDAAVASQGRKGPLPKKIKNSRAPRPWSPLFAAARATYRRSPLLSAVRAARPQAAVLYTFSQLCLERFRVHVTPRTAAVAAAAVLPAPAQRACVRAAAGAGPGPIHRGRGGAAEGGGDRPTSETLRATTGRAFASPVRFEVSVRKESSPLSARARVIS